MSLETIIGDILRNLDIIGSLTNHQTLMVEGDQLQFDTRYWQGLRRFATGDGRAQVLQAIGKTLGSLEEVIHSYQCNRYIEMIEVKELNNDNKENKDKDKDKDAKKIINKVACSNSTKCNEQVEIAENILSNLKRIVLRREKVEQGFKILATFERYTTDKGFQIKLETFSERIGKICKKCEVLIAKIESLTQ